MEGIKVTEPEFRPYSLRRGGATSLFVKVGSLDRVLLLGRWTAVKTAKIYLNSGLAMLTDLEVPFRLLRPFHTIYFNFLPSVHTLEPAQWSRTGGRGNAGVSGKMAKKAMKAFSKKAKKASKLDKKKRPKNTGSVISRQVQTVFVAQLTPAWRGTGGH